MSIFPRRGKRGRQFPDDGLPASAALPTTLSHALWHEEIRLPQPFRLAIITRRLGSLPNRIVTGAVQ